MTSRAATSGARLSAVLLLVGLAGLAVHSWTPAAAASPGGVQVSPSSGPVGTVIHYRGRIDTHLFSKSELRDPQGQLLHGLYTDVPGCEILVSGADDHLRYNPRTKVVSGSMRIPPTGHCNQSTREHAVVPGDYYLTIGCMACVVGDFTVTKAGALPFTGSGTPILPTSLLALAALIVGATLVRMGRPSSEL